MLELDRRKSGERRKSKRYAVTIDIEWENYTDRLTGTLTDISSDGCFVLSGADVTEGEVVKVFIPLSEGVQIEFLGQVANYVNEIGFALNFISLSDEQNELLSNFLRTQR